MSGYFFSGSSLAKIDEKGRFVLPQEMRYGLVEDGKCEFVIGLGLGSCLTIYRKSAMQKIVETFKKNQHVAKFQKFFTLFFSTLHPTQVDKVGRVNLPMTLRRAMKIQKEIVIAGVMDKIELWPKEAYDAILEENLSQDGLAKITEEAFALLSDDEKPEETKNVSEAKNPIYFEVPAK